MPDSKRFLPRDPPARCSDGGDQNYLGFSVWLAGGGVPGGSLVGATDEIGLHAVERPYHFRDLHTTILHQLGLDQDDLSYLHQGRKERLTEVQGEVIREIVSS